MKTRGKQELQSIMTRLAERNGCCPALSGSVGYIWREKGPLGDRKVLTVPWSVSRYQYAPIHSSNLTLFDHVWSLHGSVSRRDRMTRRMFRQLLFF